MNMKNGAYQSQQQSMGLSDDANGFINMGPNGGQQQQQLTSNYATGHSNQPPASLTNLLDSLTAPGNSAALIDTNNLNGKHSSNGQDVFH